VGSRIKKAKPVKRVLIAKDVQRTPRYPKGIVAYAPPTASSVSSISQMLKELILKYLCSQ
jgi:hypothetical protein